MEYEVINADCITGMRCNLASNSVDAIVTDPPYGLSACKPKHIRDAMEAWLAGEVYQPQGKGFMGKAWDAFVPGPELWRECYRVLKPGGHMVAFAGSRTVDLMGLSIRLAEFEIRDQLQWIYGSGFPKSANISKLIDKAAGAEREVIGRAESWNRPESQDGDLVRMNTSPESYDLTAPATDLAKQWEGWGTALKPAHEPVILARKPLIGTVAANVAEHRTGGINVDGCRVASLDGHTTARKPSLVGGVAPFGSGVAMGGNGSEMVRWPANVILDEQAGALLDEQSGNRPGMSGGGTGKRDASMFGVGGVTKPATVRSDNGGASRFFYCPKASKKEREAGLGEFALARRTDGRKGDCANPRLRTSERRNTHPTVKPIALMQWLCRLITPPGGLIVDPFTGSGSTGCAAIAEGFRFWGTEMSEEYANIARARIKHHAP